MAAAALNNVSSDGPSPHLSAGFLACHKNLKGLCSYLWQHKAAEGITPSDSVSYLRAWFHYWFLDSTWLVFFHTGVDCCTNNVGTSELV